MDYNVLLTLHLFAAILFVGTVFFEVLILENVRKRVPREVMRTMEIAIGKVARKIIPWAILVLYSAGVGMAWQYRAILAHPLQSSFGLLLTIKIVLALSVLAHFLTAMTLLHTGKMRSVYFRRIHISIFIHMLGIVFLAKSMFYLHW
ncbi:hypothetical protein ERD78_10365 [Allopusillimonas soli]|uniref:Integral membrane protein n=1 Tax=Allopusillimonas soli TaxID=659016 RepID=A0A853FI43_9BURK|nr:hypothetical protein [Allopusillimonas soli]NYT37646.1 hypothetical protein [Allopusillimonas soli]TEA74393.1 hypothetical protein ERD78_10365 [Allopusillimonas soli]